MKRRLKGFVQLSAWVMIGLLAADIGIQIYQLNKGNITIDFDVDRWLGKLVKISLDTVNSNRIFFAKSNRKKQSIEYYPSMEDLEAVANENSAMLIEGMENENSDMMQKENLADNVDCVKTEDESEIDADQYVETLAMIPTGEFYSQKSLTDYNFVLGHFYVVDPSTAANASLIDGARLYGEDMTMDLSGDEPKILIYHTHSQERYADSVPGKEEDTVVGVGSRLKKVLEEKYGVAVYHDTSVYDMQDGVEDRNMAYSQAAVAVQNILDEHPSIEVVIDLHRDGVPDHVHLATEVNGKDTAQIMFLNGLCRDSNGDDNNFIGNPNLDANLAFSLQLQLKAKAYFPDFVRHIYLRAYRYNLHFKPRSLLIEVGAQNNTVDEAKNAMEPLADILYAVLSGQQVVQ